jgi:hypothetical protein
MSLDEIYVADTSVDRIVQYGAKTLSIMVLSITTFSINILSMT